MATPEKNQIIFLSLPPASYKQHRPAWDMQLASVETNEQRSAPWIIAHTEGKVLYKSPLKHLPGTVTHFSRAEDQISIKTGEDFLK